jgi:maltose alpha-D-glucosyltransferase / alpha-amylase
VRRVEIADHVEWKPNDRDWLVTLARVETASGETQTYFLPLTLVWEEIDESLLRALGAFTIAQVRQQARIGVLADAFGDENFARALVAAVGEGLELQLARGKLQFKPTNAFSLLAGKDPAALRVTLPEAQTTNTIVMLGDRLFVKGYRRLQAGTSPEVEIGRYLTEVAQFPNAVPVAGSVEYHAEDGRSATIALIQGYVQNQGNAWDYTVGYLERFFDDTAREASTATGPDVHGGYTTLAHTLGTRTAQLHAAFARATGDAAFDPASLTAADVTAWTERARSATMDALDGLARRREALAEPLGAVADRLLAQRDRLLARIGSHANDRSQRMKTRLHGDFHLGQVLLAQDDVVIIDFEGEPSRPMQERAEKLSALKDVAGMLRSFDYAMHAALFNFVADRPDARTAMEAPARHWQAQARDAFLDGYDAAALVAGIAPARAEMDALLELFILEKAAYELKYEVDNRPDWVGIPLNGLLDILDRGR